MRISKIDMSDIGKTLYYVRANKKGNPIIKTTKIKNIVIEHKVVGKVHWCIPEEPLSGPTFMNTTTVLNGQKRFAISAISDRPYKGTIFLDENVAKERIELILDEINEECGNKQRRQS